MEETVIQIQPTVVERTPIARAIRAFLETNYFYVISAGLMILGCYLLMRSTPVSGGELSRVLHGLLVLQGYEFLVLGTITMIRHRLPTIEDTLTLVGVEMLLLFDPTFFANNLHTLVQSDRVNELGPWVNMVALALVPVKLWLIAKLNGFRLARTTWLYLLICGAVVYLAPALLATTDPVLGRSGTFWALCWVVGITFVLPPSADGIIASGRERIRSPRHHRWVPRFFLQFPAILVLFHLGETWVVHKINFQGALLAPLFLAIGARILLQLRDVEFGVRLALLDMFALAAVIASVPAAAIKPLEVYNAPEPFFTSILPLVCSAGAAAFVYTLGWLLTGRRVLLARPAMMMAAGCVWLAWEKGAVAWLWTWLAAAFSIVLENVFVIELGLVLLGLALSVVYWQPRATMLIGFWIIGWLLRLPEIGLYSHFAETFQLACMVLLVGSIMEDDPSETAVRKILAAIIVLTSMGREFVAPFDWSIYVVYTYAALLLIYGFAIGDRIAKAFGGTVVFVTTVWLMRSGFLSLGAPTLVIASSLILFAAGIYVSFAKERLLERLDGGLPRKESPATR